MFQFARLALALAAPLLLTACLLTPGRFTSTLDIGRDRSFTFTYIGEVVLNDPGSFMAAGAQPMLEEPEEDAHGDGNVVRETPRPPERPTEISEAQRRQIIEALSRETGYRSVEYVGENRFRVDYSISGRLDRNFVYPVNIDAAAIFPWIAVELRRDGTARMTALAFGDGDMGDAMRTGAAEANRHREGTFTLTTDADLVMHNNEEGTSPGARTTVSWRVTPTTRDAPTAVVRFPG
ncbi:MAG: hypothetical protein ACXWUX_03110 [Allosphingosinicella sp.]